ncbi:MAG: pseudouridine synthase [Burkholderiales bacterium]
MPRSTLKITKPPAAEAARAPSSRAIRARLQATRNRPPPPVEPSPPATAPAAAPAAARRPQAQAASEGAAARSGPGKRPRRRAAAPVPAPAAAERAATSVAKRPRAKSGPANAAPPRASAPAVRARPDADESPRLSKRMSELGLCSRREADEWIARGWVKVDGTVVDTLGTRVERSARIEIATPAAMAQQELVTILLNKPVGYVSGQAEDGYKPASVLIVPENHWDGDPSRIPFKPAHLRGLAPAGRLDIDSTGLLVFTQDGRVAKRLIGADSEVEKEYLVRVEGTLDAAGMRLLQHGLVLDGVKLKPARVSWQNEHQLRFVLREGRKRQIRRMCEQVGLTVTGLKRVRSGSVSLGPLPVGQWRYLRRDEKF